MGKFTSIVQFKGKVGELVGSRDSKGDMTVRRHQPDVKNPNTIPQVKARTRFLAASALGSTLTSAAIGLEPYAKGNKITLRNAIIKKNMSNPSIIYVNDQTQGSYIANTDFEKIILSEGMLDPINGATAEFDTVEGTKVGINVTLPVNASYVQEGRKAVVVAISVDSNTVLTAVGDFNGQPVGMPFSGSSQASETYAVHVYAMRTATIEDGYTFYSLFNGGVIESGSARATLKEIAGKAEYSNNTFVSILSAN